MYKHFIFVLMGCCIGIPSFSQDAKRNIPLHLYLQQNFDTTIILQSGSTWSDGPNYRVLSIKNGGVYPFTYKSPLGFYKAGGLPEQLANKFGSWMMSFRNALPDTNIYFLPKFIYAPQEAAVKKSVDSLQLWQTDDDVKQGDGCGEKRCYIYDTIRYIIWLITKNEIRQLVFYAPEFFEECCPGRIGRQRALRLIQIMNTTFH